MKNIEKQCRGGIFEAANKPIKKIAFIPIAVACIFLFNAFINVIDIIPDFIGYIIMSSALVKLGTLNSDIEAASKCFRYMIGVDLSKYAALMWIFGVTFGDEQSTAILLVTFIYAVIEVIFLILAFSKLFSGLTNLGYVHANTSVLGSKREGGRSYSDKIKAFTFFFVVARAVLTVAPELSVLTITEYTEGSFVMYLYEYIGTMRGIAFVFVTVIGVIWLCKIFGYFKRISKDVGFCESLTNRYNEEIVPSEAVFVKRQMAIALAMLVFAVAFTFDVRFEGVSIIPDAIASVFFAFTVFALRKLVTFNHPAMFSLTAFFLVSNVIRHIVEYKFFDEYYYGAVYRSPEVYSAYCKMCAVSVITVVAQLALVIGILLCLWKVIERYTGFVMGEDEAKNQARLDAVHKEQRRKTLILALGAVISAASELVFIFGAVKYGFADEVAFVGSIVLLVTLLKAFSDVKEEIEAKYMLQ